MPYSVPHRPLVLSIRGDNYADTGGLEEVSFSGKNAERQLVLPDQKLDVISNVVESSAEERLLQVSGHVSNLLLRPPAGCITSDSYAVNLYQKGLANKSGRIHQRELTSLVLGWLEPLSAFEVYRVLKNGLRTERNWVANVASKGGSLHHPLKLIVIWSAIGSSLAEFKECAEQVTEQLELDLSVHGRSTISEDLFRKVYSEVGSIIGVAANLGMSVTTACVFADKFGVSYRRRAKAITEEVRKGVQEDIVRGKSSAELAVKYGISVVSVNRVARAVRAEKS